MTSNGRRADPGGGVFARAEPGGGTGTPLAAALALWEQFPAGGDRPLVLTGPRLLEPGYTNGCARQAFADRDVLVAPGVPAQAVACLVGVLGPLSPSGRDTRTLLGAELIRHGFRTDRGEQQLSAWSLSVSGSLGPIVVLDADEQARLWSPSPAWPAAGVAGERAELDGSGTRVRYEFYASPLTCADYAGVEGGVERGFGVEVATSSSAVAIALQPQQPPRATRRPLAYAQRHQLVFDLPTPLGPRVLLNAVGRPIEVCRATGSCR
jgi:hypothetical protein